MTRAQKDRDDRNARAWALAVVAVMLLISVVANARSSMEHGLSPLGIGIAVVPPVSLFVSSSLLERVKKTEWYVVALMTTSALVSLAFSWVHIAEVAAMYGQAPWIAWLLPACVDVPMVLAGKVLMDHRKAPAPPPRKAAAPRKAARPRKASGPHSGVGRLAVAK